MNKSKIAHTLIEPNLHLLYFILCISDGQAVLYLQSGVNFYVVTWKDEINSAIDAINGNANSIFTP